MAFIKVGAAASEVLQGAKHVLYVEGNGDEGLDVAVLGELLSPRVRVAPLDAENHAPHAPKDLLLLKQILDERLPA
jgi:hypothetical protein